MEMRAIKERIKGGSHSSAHLRLFSLISNGPFELTVASPSLGL